MPRVRGHDDHVASRGVDVLALDLVTPLAVVEDKDFGVRMPMATRAAAGNNPRVHDRCDEAVLKSGQLAELTTSGRHRPSDELKFGVGYMAGLHRWCGLRRLGSLDGLPGAIDDLDNLGGWVIGEINSMDLLSTIRTMCRTSAASSHGEGHSIAWFNDPAGNGLCVVQMHRTS